jgi:uncharacterized protein
MSTASHRFRLVALSFALAGLAGADAGAQGRPQRDTVLVAKRDSLERELQRIAVVDRKLMVPMRDGAKMCGSESAPRVQVVRAGRPAECRD